MKNLENSEKLGTVLSGKRIICSKEKAETSLAFQVILQGVQTVSNYHIFAVKRDAPIYSFLKNGS